MARALVRRDADDDLALVEGAVGEAPGRPLGAVGVRRPEPCDPDGQHHQGAAP
jgi:hypothetical protein